MASSSKKEDNNNSVQGQGQEQGQGQGAVGYTIKCAAADVERAAGVLGLGKSGTFFPFVVSV